MDPQIKLIDVSGALAREQAFWPNGYLRPFGCYLGI